MTIRLYGKLLKIKLVNHVWFSRCELGSKITDLILFIKRSQNKSKALIIEEVNKKSECIINIHRRNKSTCVLVLSLAWIPLDDVYFYAVG